MVTPGSWHCGIGPGTAPPLVPGASALPILTHMATAALLTALLGVRAALASSTADLLKLGDASFAAGEYNAAVRHYTDAIDKDPNTALLFTKRAAAHMSLRHQAQALRVSLL